MILILKGENSSTKLDICKRYRMHTNTVLNPLQVGEGGTNPLFEPAFNLVEKKARKHWE